METILKLRESKWTYIAILAVLNLIIILGA